MSPDAAAGWIVSGWTLATIFLWQWWSERRQRKMAERMFDNMQQSLRDSAYVILLEEALKEGGLRLPKETVERRVHDFCRYMPPEVVISMAFRIKFDTEKPGPEVRSE